MAFAIARMRQVTTRTQHAPPTTVDSPSKAVQEQPATARSALDRAARPRPARTRPARDLTPRDVTVSAAAPQRAPEVTRPAPVTTFDRLADSAQSHAGARTRVTPRLRPA